MNIYDRVAGDDDRITGDSGAMSAASAARDNENHRLRIIRLNALTADQRAALLDEAKRQLHAETHSPVIPTRLAENRAADLLDQKEPF